jgi:hypothetical protein
MGLIDRNPIEQAILDDDERTDATIMVNHCRPSLASDSALYTHSHRVPRADSARESAAKRWNAHPDDPQELCFA